MINCHKVVLTRSEFFMKRKAMDLPLPTKHLPRSDSYLHGMLLSVISRAAAVLYIVAATAAGVTGHCAAKVFGLSVLAFCCLSMRSRFIFRNALPLMSHDNNTG